MCDTCTTMAAAPTTAVPEWTEVAIDQLTDPHLQGRALRAFCRMTGQDGDTGHLVLAMEGAFTAPVRDPNTGAKFVALVPDPEASMLSPGAREHAREIVAKRAAEALAEDEPGSDLWGPLDDRWLLLADARYRAACDG